MTEGMRFFRRHVKIVTLVLVIGFSFAALELYADHDLNGSCQQQHCCVQCCPCHNLVPPSTPVVSLNVPSTEGAFVEFEKSVHQNLLLNKIYRPPISHS